MANTPRSILAVLVISALGGVVIAALGGAAVVRSNVQLLLLFILIIPLSRILYGDIRIPRVLLLGALLATLTGALLRGAASTISNDTFVIAQLKQDKLQVESKILRDGMRRSVSSMPLLRVGTIDRAISTRLDAEMVLLDDNHINGVVWGTQRWVNVSLRVAPEISLNALNPASYARDFLTRNRVANLRVIIAIPLVGMSNATSLATSDFIGRLADVWGTFPKALLAAQEQPDVDVDLEQKLRVMARLKAAWTSPAHRAVPMWMTGTYHLMRAVSGLELSSGELKCALRSFEAARAQLRPTDNPDLTIAIENNLAIATLLQAGVGLETKQARRQAQKIWRSTAAYAAKGAGKAPELNGVQAVLSNYAALINDNERAQQRR
ncbi:MAG: hypothetical protein NTV65_06040 [Proteobacteria bacterium]|nr:hypothetical protein [Pseudomonadota bacterium]